DYKVRDLALAQPLTNRALERRKTLLGAVDSLASQVKGNDQMATYDEFQRRAAEIVLSAEAQAAFDIEKEGVRFRTNRATNKSAKGCLWGPRFVKGGLKKG